MNRTSKRIIEYPFQPLRRNCRRFPSARIPPRNRQPFTALYRVGPKGSLSDSEDPQQFFIVPSLWPN
jgi:hypothetical protein